MRTPTIPAMGIERGSMPAETPQRKITDSRPSLRVVVKASRKTCHHPDGLPPFCSKTWPCMSSRSIDKQEAHSLHHQDQHLAGRRAWHNIRHIPVADSPFTDPFCLDVALHLCYRFATLETCV